MEIIPINTSLQSKLKVRVIDVNAAYKIKKCCTRGSNQMFFISLSLSILSCHIFDLTNENTETSFSTFDLSQVTNKWQSIEDKSVGNFIKKISIKRRRVLGIMLKYRFQNGNQFLYTENLIDPNLEWEWDYDLGSTVFYCANSYSTQNEDKKAELWQSFMDRKLNRINPQTVLNCKVNRVLYKQDLANYDIGTQVNVFDSGVIKSRVLSSLIPPIVKSFKGKITMDVTKAILNDQSMLTISFTKVGDKSYCLFPYKCNKSKFFTVLNTKGTKFIYETQSIEFMCIISDIVLASNQYEPFKSNYKKLE